MGMSPGSVTDTCVTLASPFPSWGLVFPVCTRRVGRAVRVLPALTAGSPGLACSPGTCQN